MALGRVVPPRRAPSRPAGREWGRKYGTSVFCSQSLRDTIIHPNLVVDHDSGLKNRCSPSRFREIAIDNLSLDGGSKGDLFILQLTLPVVRLGTRLGVQVVTPSRPAIGSFPFCFGFGSPRLPLGRFFHFEIIRARFRAAAHLAVLCLRPSLAAALLWRSTLPRLSSRRCSRSSCPTLAQHAAAQARRADCHQPKRQPCEYMLSLCVDQELRRDNKCQHGSGFLSDIGRGDIGRDRYGRYR